MWWSRQPLPSHSPETSISQDQMGGLEIPETFLFLPEYPLSCVARGETVRKFLPPALITEEFKKNVKVVERTTGIHLGKGKIGVVAWQEEDKVEQNGAESYRSRLCLWS